MRGITILPIIIEVEKGGISAALMDGKGFSKSLEQGQLWLSHPQTGRILPHKGNGHFLKLEKRENHYYALLPEGSEDKPYSFIIEEADIETHSPLDKASTDGFNGMILASLSHTIAMRNKERPEGSYTSHLFNKGMAKIRKKCGEEAIELLLAESCEDLVYESADLIYHMMVLLEAKGLSMADVLTELENRDV